MSALSPSQAIFIGFAVEGLLNGANIVLFGLAVTFITSNRRRRSINTWLLIGLTVILILCTTHFLLEFSHVYIGLMVKGYSIGNEDNILIAADTIFSITDCVGQLLLIYRCWTVWEKQFLVILLPLLMSLTSLACAMAGVGILTRVDPTAPLAPPEIVPLGKVAFGLPLGTNVLVTALIIFRIWRISMGESKVFPSKKLHVVTIIVIESGALVVLAQMAFVVLFVTQSPAQNVAVSVAEQIYGIAPTLIILQVGMGNAIEEISRPKGVSNFSTQEPAVISLRVHIAENRDVELGPYSANSRISKSSF